MTKDEVPSVNPKLDAMCEMLKTIHDLNERNKMLEAQIEIMKNCGNCKNFSPTYGLCCYSLGDGDYDCRLRKWEIKEND